MIGLIILTIPVVLVILFLLVYRLLRLRPLWMKILIWFSLPILLIIGTVISLDIYSNGFIAAPRCRDEEAFLAKLICGISETYDDFAPYFRPLPADEEMIANFYEHRADFERLVKIYRKDLSVPTNCVRVLIPTPEIKAIMNRVNIAYITDDQVLWIPPDPYSKDPNFLEKRMNLHMKMSGRYNSPERRKFSGVILRYSYPRVMTLKCGLVYKEYYYFPLPPRVEKGVLHVPATLSTGGDGPVVQSLNRCPDKLPGFGAAYKEIEPHWFIEMFRNDK